MNNTIQPLGFSSANPRDETESPGFMYKPACDRPLDSSASRPFDRRPVNKPARARQSSPGASTAQRPMGAVSFAKMALFHQNENEDELRPLPRPPIPAGNVAWSDEEDGDVEMNDHETKFQMSEMSVRTDSPEPSHRQRFLAATTTDLLYKNPDESDSDMSSSIGQVDETTDLDSFMHFPFPPPAVAKSTIAAPAADYPFQYRRALVPHKSVPLNVSLDPETPHISWVARRAKEIAEKEDEDAVPGITVARTNKKIRRRLELYSNKPKRKYVWKTENKNKNKRKSVGGKAGERTAGEITSSEGNTDRTPETSTSTKKTQKRTSTTTRGITRSTDEAEDEAAARDGRLVMHSRSSVLGKRGRVGEVRGEGNLKRRRVPVVEDDDEDEDDEDDYDEDDDEDDDKDDKDFVR